MLLVLLISYFMQLCC